MNKAFEWRWLGRMNFENALALRRTGREKAGESRRHRRIASARTRTGLHNRPHARPIEPGGRRRIYRIRFFATNRGGQATYHGPGQLMGYPIVDLRRCGQDLHRYLRWLEGLLIQTLATYEISARTRPGLTGVWVEDRKIASIGVGVRHWITMHGFALNVCGDLAPFDKIIPCGIRNVTMTSIEKETGRTFSPGRQLSCGRDCVPHDRQSDDRGFAHPDFPAARQRIFDLTMAIPLEDNVGDIISKASVVLHLR